MALQSTHRTDKMTKGRKRCVVDFHNSIYIKNKCD